MNKEKIAILAQAAEGAQGIPIKMLLMENEIFNAEIHKLAHHLEELKIKCKEGLEMTNKIISHPNYNEHNEGLSRFINLWHDVINDIDTYQNKISYYLPSVDKVSVSATYDRRLRKILNDIKNNIDNILTSASILQEFSDQIHLNVNFHMNYSNLNQFKSEIEKFVKILKDKDFALLNDDEVVAIQNIKSNKLTAFAEEMDIPEESVTDEASGVPGGDPGTTAEAESELVKYHQHIQNAVNSLILNNDNLKSLINQTILFPINNFFGFYSDDALPQILAYDQSFNKFAIEGWSESLLRSLEPNEVDSLMATLNTILATTKEMLNKLSNDYPDYFNTNDINNDLNFSLDAVFELLNDLKPIKDEWDARTLEGEETPEDKPKPTYDEIVNKFNQFQAKYPITFVAKNAPEEIYGFYTSLEAIIGQMKKEETSEAFSNYQLEVLSQEFNLRQFLIDALDIVEDVYAVTNERNPSGYEVKLELLGMINKIQQGIDAIDSKTDNPEKQEEIWSSINSYLITINEGLLALKDTLPKTSITNLSNGTQRYTSDIINEIEQYRALVGEIRDFHEVKIPSRPSNFSTMNRDRILETLNGYILELSGLMSQTTEWEYGSETSGATLESVWDQLTEGINKLYSELREEGAQEYDLTTSEFIKATEMIDGYLTKETNALQQVMQLKKSMEETFPALNQMIYTVHELSQKEGDAYNLKRKDFGAMQGALHSAGTQMQEDYNKLWTLEQSYKNSLNQLQNLKIQRNIGASAKHEIYINSQLRKQLDNFWRGLTGKTLNEKNVNDFVYEYIDPLTEKFKTLELQLYQKVSEIYRSISELTNRDVNHSLVQLTYNLFPSVVYQNSSQEKAEPKGTE